VVSSDDDVMKSQLDVVTDCQANIFPTFESLSPQEQKTEVRRIHLLLSNLCIGHLVAISCRFQLLRSLPA
jgi:hypothetical protein